MTRTHLKTLPVILAVILGCLASANSQARRVQPKSPCPDEQVYTGNYRNLVYGVSIVIPAGLKGYWNSARCAPAENYGCVCMGDHGRFIPLSRDGRIDVFVGYQMEVEWSAIDRENNAISSLKSRQHAEQVQLIGSKSFRLGDLKGRRFVARFIEDGKIVVTDHIIALHRGVEYEVVLNTSADRYERHKIQFEKVIASWRLNHK